MKLEQRKAAAYHKLEVQQQRWMRTARTHLNGSQYSVYDEPSTVLRVEQRLQAADDSLEDVYTDWVAARREWTLCYTYKKLKKSAEKNPELTDFKHRALLRYHAFANTTKAPKSEHNTFLRARWLAQTGKMHLQFTLD